jgi:hypothetical protein
MTISRAARATCAAAYLSMGFACTDEPEKPSNGEVAQNVIDAIVSACPPSPSDDLAARQTCADGLSSSAVTNAAFAARIAFGEQQDPNSYAYDHGLTHLAARVALRIYIPLFYATGGHVETRPDGAAVAHVQVGFRGSLDPNEYPYPFWHSDAKWTNYNTTKEMLYVVSDAQVVAALRSKDVDPARPIPPHAWDGQWTKSGSDGRVGEPHVSLYQNIFSRENPHIDGLESDYYAFANFVRAYQCDKCHAPSNESSMPLLSIVNIPAQALAFALLPRPEGEMSLSTRIASGSMPPYTPDLGVVLRGVPEGPEREQATQLATAFATKARSALQWDADKVAATAE